MEMLVTVFATFMVITALLTYYKWHVPAFFFMGVSGLLILCGAAVPILGLAKDIVIGLGVVGLGWGFARALTVDNQQLRDFHILELLSNRKPDRSESLSVQAKPKQVSLRESLISAAILILVGAVLWYARPAHSPSAYIFLLFGVQLGVAALTFLGQKTGTGGTG